MPTLKRNNTKTHFDSFSITKYKNIIKTLDTLH